MCYKGSLADMINIYLITCNKFCAEKITKHGKVIKKKQEIKKKHNRDEQREHLKKERKKMYKKLFQPIKPFLTV